MSNINIIDYCKNPVTYVGKLDQETINYYNSICDARDKLKENKSTGERVGEALNPANLVPNLVMGLLTPEALQMISIEYGIKFAGTVFATNLLRTLGSGTVVATADKMAAGVFGKAATKYLSNIAALSKGILESATRTAIAVYAVQLIRIAATVVNVIDWIQILLLVTGIIIDAIDPCGFNNLLTGKDLIKLSIGYNDTFRDKLISSISRGQYIDGKPIYTNKYPIVFNVDNLLLLEKEEQYGDKIPIYLNEFYEKLTLNSNGEFIDWNIETDLLTQKDVDKTVENLSVITTGNNFVLYKIVKNNFFWILAFVVLFILFILFLKV